MMKYHPGHTWVRLESDLAVIGLTFYAQSHLGEIVYIDLPEIGREVSAGQPIAGIESAKTTSEIIAPLSGTVLESNGRLEATPGLINESPLDKGWITQIQPSSLEELSLLLDDQAYQDLLAGLPVGNEEQVT